MGGPGAVVSYHRLTQEFYGLPHDLDVLANRLLIESVHELGHTLHLTHCQEYRCAMAPSHAVEWIDIKDSGFCEECLAKTAQAVCSSHANYMKKSMSSSVILLLFSIRRNRCCLQPNDRFCR